MAECVQTMWKRETQRHIWAEVIMKCVWGQIISNQGIPAYCVTSYSAGSAGFHVERHYGTRRKRGALVDRGLLFDHDDSWESWLQSIWQCVMSKEGPKTATQIVVHFWQYAKMPECTWHGETLALIWSFDFHRVQSSYHGDISLIRWSISRLAWDIFQSPMFIMYFIWCIWAGYELVSTVFVVEGGLLFFEVAIALYEIRWFNLICDVSVSQNRIIFFDTSQAYKFECHVYLVQS